MLPYAPSDDLPVMILLLTPIVGYFNSTEQESDQIA
jgi:hypothetical protein